MLQFPYGVNPNNGVSLDGSKRNSFTCIISGTVCVAYQITILDNNTQSQVYGGPKQSVRVYNGQELSMQVPENAFSNGKDLIWKVRLWTDRADIPSFVRSAPGGTATKTFVDNIETPYYFFKSRSLPVISITNFQSVITDRAYYFTGSYSQAENSSIQYYIFNLYNSDDELIDTTGKIFSADLKYDFDGFNSDTKYKIELVCMSQDNVEVTTSLKEFSVVYSPPNIDISPSLRVSPKEDAIQVLWRSQLQSVPEVYGEWEIIKNFPFYGTNSVHIKKNGYIKYKEVDGIPLEMSDDFTVLMSTCLNNGFSGKIIELEGDGLPYYVAFDGSYFYYSKDGVRTNLFSPYEKGLEFVITTTGIPQDKVGYVWMDNESWVDSKKWTEPTLPLDQEQYKITIQPEYAEVVKVV